MILKTSHLKKYYGREESLVKALDDVNLTVEKGQFAAIIGTSGSGKSTLLNLLGGLDHPTSGGVEVEGKNIGEMTEEQLTVFRRKRIGFIFQNYNLIPYLTAYENIVLPVRLDGKREDRKFLEEDMAFYNKKRTGDFWKRRCIFWNWKKSFPIIPVIFPADSSSGWQLPGPWFPSRPLFWQMNPPEIWTAAQAIRSLIC